MEFTLKTTIPATPKQIYKSWLSTQRHSKMTGAPAFISDTVGDTYTAWEGALSGKNVILEPYSKIIQTWRAPHFKEEEEDSIVKITLKDLEGKTGLTLKHSNLPENSEECIAGWEKHYFTPMKAYFLALNEELE